LRATAFDAGDTILDVGWAIVSQCDRGQLRSFEAGLASGGRDVQHRMFRAVHVKGLDGNRYWVGVNFGEEDVSVPAGTAIGSDGRATDLVSGKEWTNPEDLLAFPAGVAKVMRKA
jgi:hypothetical protein